MSQFSGILDQIAARLPGRPAAYLWLFFIWGALLWFLSARSPDPDVRLIIPHLDKAMHFSYFAFGGAVLAAYGGLRWPGLTRRQILVAVVLACCIIGRLDEYHQGFTPGRSGNDPGDWLADTLGGLFGSWFLIRYLLSGILANQKKL